MRATGHCNEPSWSLDRGGEFQRFCRQVAGVLGANELLVPRIATFLGGLRRLPLVWFQFAPTAGCRDAFARCTDPWAGEMLFAQLPAHGDAA
jgi:Ni,Fe-hydrogenase I small subunit